MDRPSQRVVPLRILLAVLGVMLLATLVLTCLSSCHHAGFV